MLDFKNWLQTLVLKMFLFYKEIIKEDKKSALKFFDG